MHTFTDSLGRDWPLGIDYAAIRRVREGGGVDFMKCFEDATILGRLYLDITQLIDVLGAVLSPVLTAKGISFDQFAAGMIGDVNESAYDALIQALSDFFPATRRKMLLHVLAKIKAVGGSAKPPTSSDTSSAAPAPVESIPAV